MKKIKDYKNAALAALNGKWAPAVICSVVYVILTMAVSMSSAFADENSPTGIFIVSLLLQFVLSFIVTMPAGLGYYNAHKELFVSGDDKMTSNMFKIGFGNWFRNVWAMLLYGVVVFIGFIFLIVPGVVIAIGCSLAPYLIVDNPELSAAETLKLSWKMMKGHKWQFFVLSLSFIGWGCLCMLTLGIGFFWLYPYMYTAIAAFYVDVKAEYEANNNTNN